MSGWFGAKPTPSPGPSASEAASVYYAGAAGMDVYAEPCSKSKLVGNLSPYEKVARYKVERGYAYVKASKNGLSGWVNNAQLLWRLPAAAAPRPGAPPSEGESAPVVEAPAPRAQEPAAEEAPEAPAASEPEAPAPTATSTLAAAGATPTPRGVAPSLFDSY